MAAIIPGISSYKVAGVREAIEAVGAGTVDDLRRAIGNALDRFSPTECGNYLANAGYAV